MRTRYHKVLCRALMGQSTHRTTTSPTQLTTNTTNMPKVVKEKKKSCPTELKRFNGSRWTTSEQQLLVKLRDVDEMSFEAIADKLSRKVDAVAHRYEKLKEEATLAEDFIWTPELDDQIITGRAKGTTVRDLAGEMSLPLGVVQERVNVIRKEGKIPVNSANQGKGQKIEWTEEEDEVFLRMYIAMAEEVEIHKTAKLTGKTLSAMRTRKTFHLRGSKVGDPNPSVMYRKLLMEYGNPNYRWTKQDAIDRNFVFGSWNRMAEPVEHASKTSWM
jgi:hypothetical protein